MKRRGILTEKGGVSETHSAKQERMPGLASEAGGNTLSRPLTGGSSGQIALLDGDLNWVTSSSSKVTQSSNEPRRLGEILTFSPQEADCNFSVSTSQESLSPCLLECWITILQNEAVFDCDKVSLPLSLCMAARRIRLDRSFFPKACPDFQRGVITHNFAGFDRSFSQAQVFLFCLWDRGPCLMTVASDMRASGTGVFGLVAGSPPARRDCSP